MPLIDTDNPRWMLELSPENIVKYSDEDIYGVICRIPSALKFIKNPKDEWIQFAVKYSVVAISFVKNPSVEIQRLAYDNNPNCLQFMESIDEDLAIEILMKEPARLHCMPDPTPMMISIAKIYS
jgi:hypothetical protein